MKGNENKKPVTLGELKASGYKSLTVKEEMRKNLIEKLSSGAPLFKGVHGYEDTVIPEIERAVLARHNMIFLGLRGQAKTRMARLLVELLDEYIPAIDGTELPEDPFNPLSVEGRTRVAEMGDSTPIRWIHRAERYTEKLATPDVTVADLVGDTDPIKAANLKLPYSDERVIHFGLIPRAHRGLFVINELPDLQPRIQVALFNILQEGDIQIRGFKLRLPLDVQFVFTANPEDYTSRGSIITPLKDRIQSQIITHYPKSTSISRVITDQESRIDREQEQRVEVPELLRELLEQIAVVARDSELVDQKSGVSARLTISAYELLVSAVERRILRNREKKGSARISDLLAVVPAITGKVELVYEGEQEGAAGVAHMLIGKAIRAVFPTLFPDPQSLRKRKQQQENPYAALVTWFNSRDLELEADLTQPLYERALNALPALRDLVKRYVPRASATENWLYMEFILHGLAEYSMISKHVTEEGLTFGDMMKNVFSSPDFDDADAS